MYRVRGSTSDVDSVTLIFGVEVGLISTRSFIFVAMSSDQERLSSESLEKGNVRSCCDDEACVDRRAGVSLCCHSSNVVILYS